MKQNFNIYPQKFANVNMLPDFWNLLNIHILHKFIHFGGVWPSLNYFFIWENTYLGKALEKRPVL